LRSAAQNEGIFGEIGSPVNEWTQDTTSPLFESLQKKYALSIDESSLTINLPSGTTKETLLDIKCELETYPTWRYQVRLNIDGQIIDTKKNISSH
jgi:hypothetical protein